MKKLSELSLFAAIVSWAGIVGAVLHLHIATMPPLLSNLPESSIVVTGTYGVKDADFWKIIHPITIVSTMLALVINWKSRERRKFIGVAMAIYAIALVATAVYFVPELMAFFASSQNTSVTAAEWLERGQRWQYLSWIRGLGMVAGFVSLLLALKQNPSSGSSGS